MINSSNLCCRNLTEQTCINLTERYRSCRTYRGIVISDVSIAKIIKYFNVADLFMGTHQFAEMLVYRILYVLFLIFYQSCFVLGIKLFEYVTKLNTLFCGMSQSDRLLLNLNFFLFWYDFFIFYISNFFRFLSSVPFFHQVQFYFPHNAVSGLHIVLFHLFPDCSCHEFFRLSFLFLFVTC